MSPDLAYLMNSILHGVPASELGMDSLPVAGKTGTTDGYTSSWMMGYTPDLAVGTFMGHINAGPTCNSGFLAYGSPGVPTSGWICPTKVLWGEDVGAVLWKPFLVSYYSGSRSWPASWKPPSGVTSFNVCKSDGGLATASTSSSQTYLEVFLRSAPPKPCGQNVAPGVPTPTPVPSPTPSPVVTPLPAPSPVPPGAPSPVPGTSPTPHK